MLMVTERVRIAKNHVNHLGVLDTELRKKRIT